MDAPLLQIVEERIAAAAPAALERAMESLWLAKAPAVASAPARAPLLCLRSFIDRRLALRADATWAALSRACHDHPYELPPTAAELAGWFETTEELVRAARQAEQGARQWAGANR